MHKLLVLYPEPADRRQFTTYYESTHLPLVQKLPGMLGCRYSLDLSGQDEESGYCAVFEADFEDRQALAQALSSPEGANVQADVPNYATGGAVILSYPVAGSWSAPPRPATAEAGRKKNSRLSPIVLKKQRNAFP